MRRKIDGRTSWDPMLMRRDYRDLAAQVDAFVLDHEVFVASVEPTTTPRMPSAKEAAGRLERYAAMLRRTFDNTLQAQRDAADALRDLLRMLPPAHFMPKVEGIAETKPLPPTNSDPIENDNIDLHVIPAMLPPPPPRPKTRDELNKEELEAKLGGKARPLLGTPGDGTGMDLDGKKRAMANSADGKLKAFKLVVDAYVTARQMRRTSADIKEAMNVLGMLADEVAPISGEPAPAPSREVVTFDAAEAHS